MKSALTIIAVMIMFYVLVMLVTWVNQLLAVLEQVGR